MAYKDFVNGAKYAGGDRQPAPTEEQYRKHSLWHNFAAAEKPVPPVIKEDEDKRDKDDENQEVVIPDFLLHESAGKQAAYPQASPKARPAKGVILDFNEAAVRKSARQSSAGQKTVPAETPNPEGKKSRLSVQNPEGKQSNARAFAEIRRIVSRYSFMFEITPNANPDSVTILAVRAPEEKHALGYTGNASKVLERLQKHLLACGINPAQQESGKDGGIQS